MDDDQVTVKIRASLMSRLMENLGLTEESSLNEMGFFCVIASYSLYCLVEKSVAVNIFQSLQFLLS
jgi:hypothetical protein